MKNKNLNDMLHNRILWITRTGILIALLLTLQWLTAGTQAFAGQYITGTCVNCILVVSVLVAGLSSGICVALFSPVFAFLLKIGPAIPQIVPCIAAGNIAFVVILHFLVRGEGVLSWKQWTGLLVAALGKFLLLHTLVTKLFIPLMGEKLSSKQVTLFSVMFSWPQLITALLGGFAAMLILPIIQKAINKRR